MLLLLLLSRFSHVRKDASYFKSLGREMYTDVSSSCFPGGISGKESACHGKRHKRCGFDPWIGKIPWRRKSQPTPVFLPGESPWTEESGGLQSTGSQRVRQA